MSVGIDDLIKESEWHPTSATAIFLTSLMCNETACANETALDEVTTEPPSEELDTTKVVVLTTIIVLTVFGNVAVILAIICRKMKMNRYVLLRGNEKGCRAFFQAQPKGVMVK
jgi:hypothetical protein